MELNIDELTTTSIPKSNLNKSALLTYDDILAKMGMYMHDGKLHLGNKELTKPSVKMECSKVKCNRLQENIKNVAVSFVPQDQNSYIYNKYFKNQQDTAGPISIVPKTPDEFNALLKQKIMEKRLHRHRISQIKSNKLIMPTENIQIASEQKSDYNKLFGFSRG